MIVLTFIRVLSSWIITGFMSFGVLLGLLVNRRISWFHPYARAWARSILAVCGVSVKVIGSENLVPGQPYVYVSNHASMFDIPAVLGWIPDDVHIVLKKELTRVPIWGWALALSPYIVIDRQDARGATKSLDEAATRIREGRSVLLFAEGTRTRSGSLLPFKRGAFTLAAKAGVPIAPVTLNNTFNILPKGSLNIRRSDIQLIIDTPIPTEGKEGREGELRLMEDVRNVITDRYVDQSVT